MINFEAFEESEFRKGQIAEFDYEIKEGFVILYDAIRNARSKERIWELSKWPYEGSSLEIAVKNAVKRHYSQVKLSRSLRVQARRLNSDEEPIKFLLEQ